MHLLEKGELKGCSPCSTQGAKLRTHQTCACLTQVMRVDNSDFRKTTFVPAHGKLTHRLALGMFSAGDFTGRKDIADPMHPDDRRSFTFGGFNSLSQSQSKRSNKLHSFQSRTNSFVQRQTACSNVRLDLTSNRCSTGHRLSINPHICGRFKCTLPPLRLKSCELDIYHAHLSYGPVLKANRDDVGS